MHNSRIITNEFEFIQPKGLDTVLALLKDACGDTLLMAGGTDVLPQMKEGRKAPGKVVSTMRVEELDFIRIEDGVMRIGGAARLKKTAEACREIPGLSVLHQGVSSIGKLQILNMATIAGNICTASPAADSVPALLALGASLTLKSAGGEREMPLGDFLLGPGKTALEPNEILYSVNVPVPGQGTGGEFLKKERVGADIAKINIAVVVQRKGDVCEGCRVAVGSCGPTALVIDGPDRLLSGRAITDPEGGKIREAGQSVADAITPIDDIRSTAEYRRKVASVVFMDAFRTAWEKTPGAIS